MMKIKTLLFLIMVIFTTANQTEATPMVDKARAKAVLVKTNTALGITHMTVKKTRKFSGKFGLAIKHERYAKKLYAAGNYDKAVLHSLYARKLATEVMSENGAKTNTLFILSAEEKAYYPDTTNDDELKQEAKADDPSDLKDEDLMNGNLNLEVQ